MSFTYNTDLSDIVSQVRFLMGDTDKSDPLISDEEITWVLDEESDDVYYAAAVSLESLASRWSREISKSADGISISSSERWRAFQDRAAELRNLAKRASRLGIPYVGGILKSEDREYLRDSDLKPLQFETGQDDHPEFPDTPRSSDVYDDDYYY